MARPTSSRSEATISEGTQIRGRVSGEGSLTVAGGIEGEVALQGDLHVAQGGSLKSNVEAASVTLEGSLEGNVTAESVHVAASARLTGDVTSAQFSLEEGAGFSGNLTADFDLPSQLGPGTSTPSRRR